MIRCGVPLDVFWTMIADCLSRNIFDVPSIMAKSIPVAPEPLKYWPTLKKACLYHLVGAKQYRLCGGCNLRFNNPPGTYCTLIRALYPHLAASPVMLEKALLLWCSGLVGPKELKAIRGRCMMMFEVSALRSYIRFTELKEQIAALLASDVPTDEDFVSDGSNFAKDSDGGTISLGRLWDLLDPHYHDDSEDEDGDYFDEEEAEWYDSDEALFANKF